MSARAGIGPERIGEWLDAMAAEVRALFPADAGAPFAMIGIRRGGVWVAAELAARLGEGFPTGELNIAFYRDDFSRIGMQPVVEPSDLRFDVDGARVLLVDDILYTGRTVRAAMNELFDWGRPASITLAVLVDRGGRELPIEAAIVGHRMTLADDEHVKLAGPSPLELSILQRGQSRA